MHLQMVARKSAGSHTSTFALHVGAQMSGGTTGSHLVDSHEQMGVHSERVDYLQSTRYMRIWM
jgi:hypothetical protein